MAVSHSRYVTTSNLQEKTDVWLSNLAGSRGRKPLNVAAKAALVVLDLQRIFCDPASPAFLPAWPASRLQCLALIDFFLKTGRPVVFTRHIHQEKSGGVLEHFFTRLIRPTDPYSEFAPEVQSYLEKAIVLDKDRFSAWSNARLATSLRQCNTVVLAGVQTQLCVLSTALGAADFSFVPVVVADACAAPNESLHVAALTVLAAGHAHVASADEIIAGLAPRENLDAPPV